MHLSSKALDALSVFVQNPGKMLGREVLMQAVWPDSFVEDANLTVAGSQLRKALGQDGDTAEVHRDPAEGSRKCWRARISVSMISLLARRCTRGRLKQGSASSWLTSGFSPQTCLIWPSGLDSTEKIAVLLLRWRKSLYDLRGGGTLRELSLH